MAFVVMGYYVYQSYAKQKEKDTVNVTVDNYYNADYLFNNDYIKVSANISDFDKEKKDIYMYLDADNNLYIKNSTGKTVLNKKITSLPKDKMIVYYNNLYDDYYEFAALSNKGELYYASLNINSKKDYKFVKLGENISDVYTPVYDKKMVFVNERVSSNFIFLNKNKELLYLNKKDKKYTLEGDLQKVKPYFDYVCSSDTSKICNDIMIYQTFDNKLAYGYNDDKIIRNEIGEEIVVREMFAVFDLNSDKRIDLDKISYDLLKKKYKFLFTVYIVSEKGEIYKLEINKSVIKKKASVSAITYNEEVVKELKYDKKDNEITSVHIIYNNGEEDKISSGLNKKIITSTIYDRQKLKIKIIPSS